MLHQQSSILGPKWRGGEGEGCWPWQADHWSLIHIEISPTWGETSCFRWVAGR